MNSHPSQLSRGQGRARQEDGAGNGPAPALEAKGTGNSVGESRSKPKRVCMLAYTLYDYDGRVQREAEALVRRGFDVVCLTLRNGDRRPERKLRGVRIQELKTVKYQGANIIRYFSSYLNYLWRSFHACNRLLFREGVHAVHIHNMPDFLVLAALVPRLMGRKLVLDVHDSVPETFASKFPKASGLVFRLLCLEEKFSALLVHKVICVNHPQRDALVRRGIPAAKTCITMNTPDHKIFAKKAPNDDPGRRGLKLIYHGTMTSRLGIDLILRATALLVGRIPSLQLHLWGNGDSLSQFQQLAEDLCLKDVVHFKPEGVPLPELPQELAGMNVGLVGNRKDAATELMLPVKLMEYVAMGIPVVAPRLKTIEYYFSDQDVTYYAPESSESMAEGIYSLYCNGRLQQEKARKAQEFLDRYGWHKQEIELADLYQSLLKG